MRRAWGEVARGVLVPVVLVAGCVLGVASGDVVASAVAVPSCRPTQLIVSIGRPNGALGTIYYPIVFTNHGARCALWGVPRVQPVGVGRRAVGPPARNESVGRMPVRHVVATKQSVSAALGVVETGNYPPSRCTARAVLGVEVSLPGFVPPTYRALRTTVCTRRVSTYILLVVAGTTGV